MTARRGGRGARIAGLAAVAAAVGLAAASRAGPGDSAAVPSAAEVVARNAAARGGLDAWRKVRTMVWLGHVESPHAPLPSLPFKLEQKRPNLTRLEIQLPGDRSVRAFDGARGWKLRSTRGRAAVEPFSPQEVRYAAAGHGIDGPLIDAAARGEAVTLQGVDRLGGRKAYHLRVHPAGGGAEDVWVDAETFLDVRFDRPVDVQGGAPRRVSATYGEYHDVEGLKIPFLVATGAGPAAASDRMRIERVVLNAPLDGATFAAPAGPRARARPALAARATAPGAARGPAAARGARGAAPP